MIEGNNPKCSLKDIDAVILCGGLGLRLRSIFPDKPKALADIKGVPFLDILISHIASFGFRRFILCIGYKGDEIKRYYEKNPFPGLKILFSQEKKRLGTAGAIKNASALLKSSPFLVANGDTFCRANLQSFFNFYSRKKAVLCALFIKSNRPEECGIVKLDKKGSVLTFEEKVRVGKGIKLVNAGIYLISPVLLSHIPQGKKYSLEYDLFPGIKKGFYGFLSSSDFLDIGTPRNYKKARGILKTKTTNWR